MTSTDIQTSLVGNRRDRLRSAFDSFFSSLGQGFNAYLAAHARIAEIDRLNAMSDAGLAKLGIAREDIPRYVFRDLIS